MKKVILASGNPGKLSEFNDLLNNVGINIEAQSAFNVPEAVEDGLTFVENAILKARNACKYTRHPAIADDSGIEVDTLNGAPGIYSARYSGPNASDSQNNDALLKALSNTPVGQRTARYQCVLVYMRHEEDPTPIICQSSWEGEILNKPQGKGGFGYDPLFWLPEQKVTAAELGKKEKNIISHRGKAMKALADKIKRLT